MKSTTKLRKIIEGSDCTMSISAHDPLLARLVQKAGFKLISISGNAVAASHLGMPDMGFLNLTDMVGVSRRIAAAVDLPVTVDAETGFGNPMNIIRTVKELERAGVAGITIEDQIAYKKCGMIEAKHPVIPAEEHAAKVRAACFARSDPDFIIVARTDAASDYGITEAIRRGHLYTEAGADMLDIEILGTEKQLRLIEKEKFDVPLKANMDEGKCLYQFDLNTLAEAGYRIASYPGIVRYTVVHSVTEALKHLKTSGSTAGFINKMATVEEYFDVVDLDYYLKLEGELLQPFYGKNKHAT